MTSDAATTTPPAPIDLLVTPGGGGITTSATPTLSAVIENTSPPDPKYPLSTVYATFRILRGTTVVWTGYGDFSVQLGPRRVFSQVPAGVLLTGVQYTVSVTATTANAATTAISAAKTVPLQYVPDLNDMQMPAPGCSEECLSPEVEAFWGQVRPGQPQDVMLPTFASPGGDPAMSLNLRLQVTGWAKAGGAVAIADPQFPAPVAPTLSYVGDYSPNQGIATTARFDALRSSADSLRISVTSGSAVYVRIVVSAVVMEDVVDEEAVEVTDQEIDTMIADSDPSTGEANPSADPVCTANPNGSAACWGADSPASSGTALEAPATAAVAELPCGLTIQQELRWTYRSRYESCRRWNVTLVLDTNEPTETYIRAELGMQAYFRPRDASVRMVATTTWKGMDSASGVPHYDEDLVQARIDYDCSGLVVCSHTVTTSPFNSANPVHSVDTGWRDVAGLNLGDIESIAGDLSVGFGLRQLQWADTWVPARGPLQIPLARCDAVDYMKSFGTNTRGCVIVEYVPTLKFRPAVETDIKESARHIRRAQLEGYPGGSIASPLHRLRGPDRDRNRNRAQAKCRNELGGQPGSCDEYPFASTEEGCFTGGSCSVARIPLDDNRRSGSRLGAFYKAQRILARDKFSVVVLGSIPD